MKGDKEGRRRKIRKDDEGQCRKMKEDKEGRRMKIGKDDEGR